MSSTQSTPSAIAISVEGLSYSYREKQVLRDISFSAGKGEMISVIGPNGVGKSTLFRCILRILPDYEGTIRIGDKDLRMMSPRALAEQIAYIPQIHRPTFGYSVLDTVLMGMARQISVFSRPGPQQIRRAEDALERIGILPLAERDFSKLSGGEQQLVLVARAIAQNAKILVMDEPTSALDYGNQFRVLKQVKALAGEGYTVLLSTHNPQQALSFADRILALRGGEVRALGTPQEAMTKQLIRDLYGVEAHFEETESGPVIVPEIS